MTHNSHKGPTVQGFPELQALCQSPTELLTAAPSHDSDKETQVPSPPPGWSKLTMSQDSTQLGADLRYLISKARLLLLLSNPVQVSGQKNNRRF